jgi:hypothetical protein
MVGAWLWRFFPSYWEFDSYFQTCAECGTKDKLQNDKQFEAFPS